MILFLIMIYYPPYTYISQNGPSSKKGYKVLDDRHASETPRIRHNSYCLHL